MSTEFQSERPEVRRAVADAAILDIPPYTNYGTGAGLDGHFAQLAQESERASWPGLTITRHPVGSRDKGFTKTVFDFDESGFTAAVFVRPHRDEPVGLLVAESLSNVAQNHRGLLVSRGVGRLVVYDVTSEDFGNDWHFGEHTYGNYVLGSSRGEDHDWRYPTKANTFTKTTPNSEAARQVLDEERPKVLDAEHNAHMGSYWAYVENPPPGLAQSQSELMREINHGLSSSPPDAPCTEELAEGVYRLPTWAEAAPYIFGKNYTQEQLLAYGDNSIHYAGREYGTIGAIYEQALFTFGASLDNEPAQLRSTALDTALCQGLALVSFVENVLNRRRLQEGDLAYPLYTQVLSSAAYWRQKLSPELAALQAGDIEDLSAVLTGAQVADILVQKQSSPAKLLGSLAQLTRIDDSFRPFGNEVVDRINQEAEYLTKKLGLVAARPSTLTRAKVAAFFLLCASAG